VKVARVGQGHVTFHVTFDDVWRVAAERQAVLSHDRFFDAGAGRQAQGLRNARIPNGHGDRLTWIWHRTNEVQELQKFNLRPYEIAFETCASPSLW
jgi:hypothetical protein